MLSNLLKGLSLTIGNPTSLAYLVGGSIFGMLSGVLPGLGGPVILSITLALIFKIPLTGVLCIFLAIHAASFFTSSITAILLNTPQHAESFAVSFDGFPMAQRGEAGRALGISAASTCLGGLVGCAFLVGFIQVINYLPEVFHPPEYVALITIALLLVATLGTDAASKAVMSAGVGVVIAAIGQDPNTGVFRFTFGAVSLYSGVGLVSMALGAFAIPQMILLYGVSSRVARQDMTGREIDSVDVAEMPEQLGAQVMGGIRETLHHWKMAILSGVVGVVTGIIPGIGGFAANFISYGLAQQVSKERAQFGTGVAEGIIAPEGSSLAKEAGSMVPLLGLGIPGGVAGALFLAALSIKGVRVGFGFTTQYPAIAYEIVWIIALGGVIGTLIGVLAAPWLARVTKVPGPCLVPIIMALSIVGAYSAGPSFFLVMEVPVFAVIGFCLRRLRYAIAVLVIALVLGNQYEQNIFLTYQLFPGASILHRPLADVLFVLAIGVLVLRIAQERRARRAAAAARDELTGEERARAELELERSRDPYPLLGMIVTIVITAVGAFAAVYAITSYDLVSALTPAIGGSMAALAGLTRLPRDVHAYVRFRSRRTIAETLVDTGEEARVIAEAEAELAPSVAVLATPAVAAEILAGNLASEGPGTVTGTVMVHEVVATDVADERYPPIEEKRFGVNGQYGRELMAFGWLLGLIGAVWLFGFYVAFIAFGIAYGLFGIRRTFATWRPRVLFSVGLATFGCLQTYVIFSALHISFTPVIGG